MADYTIKRFEDWSKRVTVTLDGVAMDSSLYTFKSKMRNRAYKTGKTYVQPDPTVVTVAIVAGQASKLDLSLTSAQTRMLRATGDIPDAQLPLLDIELTTISDSSLQYTDAQTVEILDTQAHD